MRVPFSWLCELVELDRTPEEVADLLAAAGIEVDDIERTGPQFSRVVTAVLREVRPHPDADRLSVCRVFDGERELSVVCGATNMKAGDGVALARHKARLPGGRVVKRGKLRGQLSDGMLCSEAELEIGGDADGIMILPGDVEPGVALDRHLGLGETVLVLDLTPDRADCLGMVGVAREVATLTGARLLGAAAIPPWWEPSPGGSARAVAGAGERAVEVRLEYAEGCPRYTALVMRGVRVGPSPGWLVRRLQAAGAGIHSNVVDATNYMARLLGQPFHAFDLRFLRGSTIVVRRGRDGEVFRALDGTEHVLDGDDVTICDAEGPVALGGVIGGEGSMVVDDTRDLLLESACFDPGHIRRTSRRTGVVTESSDRFARGVDPRNTMEANRRLAALIADIAGGEVVGEEADCCPEPWAPAPVTLRPHRVPGLLGLDLSADEVAGLLESDGLRVERAGGLIVAQAPPWRVDIEREVDLIEEVARLFGYDRIPLTLPAAPCTPSTRSDALEVEARRAMAALGFDELQLSSFCGADELRALGYGDDDMERVVELDNPLGTDSALMQPSLLPRMVAHAAWAARRSPDLRTFQLRRTFLRGKGETGVAETVSLAALWMGTARPASWDDRGRPADLFDLKGALEQVLERFGVGGVRFEAAPGVSAMLDPAQAARLVRGRHHLGIIGRLAPSLLATLDLPSPVYVFEIPFGDLVRGAPRTRYRAPSDFPSTQRDVALIVDERVAAGELLDRVREARPDHLTALDVFDVYTGEGVPEGSRSVAIRLVFQSHTATLSGAEVDVSFQRVLERLRGLDGVTVREGRGAPGDR